MIFNKSERSLYKTLKKFGSLWKFLQQNFLSTVYGNINGFPNMSGFISS